MSIAITGYGIISALGIGREATLDALLCEHSGIGEMRILKSAHSRLPVGEVPLANSQLAELCKSGNASDAMLADVSRSTLLGVVAAREALRHAGLENATADMAFVSGTTVGGMDITENAWLGADVPVEHHSAGSCTRDMACLLGGFKFSTTLSTACSSALNAVIFGANLIKTHRYRRVLVGGTEALTLFHLNGFNSLRILDSEPCRPFDESRNGLNLGEGAAYLVLEDADSAFQRGAAIHGYIAGYANRCDAYHQTATSEMAVGPVLAMSGALHMAGVKRGKVDYVNAHGTATQNNDSTEVYALVRVFGNDLPPFSSTKAYTGHTTSASGAIETVICLLGMKVRTAFANLRYQGGLLPDLPVVRRNTPNDMNIVMCNSFGFGGNDSSLILSRTPLPDNSACDAMEPRTVADVTITAPDACKQFLSPMQLRRMTLQMRCLVAAAYEALQKAGMEIPDAIIAATHWGCIHNSVAFLDDMTHHAEQELSPTPFMQSTHNTPASQLAILFSANGYNSTVSHDAQSLTHALLDASMQLETGQAANVLVLHFDEPDTKWDDLLRRSGITPEPVARAIIVA